MFFLAFLESSIQLFPDGTIFLHIALILAMIWLLNRTFFRPINRVIEAREKQKGGHGSEAENILHSAGGKEAEYNKAILNARSLGYELIEKEHTAAIAARDQALSVAKAEASAQLDDERLSIKQQSAEARASIANEADSLADKIAADILKA
jgi:F0F1-type ATP synthase membrane subunit b/b'